MTATVAQPPDVAQDADHEVHRSSVRRWYGVVLVGGLLGVATAGWQTVERIAWAADHDAKAACDLSSKLSCSGVFGHWQASALGIPNSVVALPVFALIASAGLAGLLRSRPSRAYLASILGVTVFMTAFITWYLEQTATDIGVLCLFCAGCMVNIVIAGVGMTRVAATERVLGEGRAARALDRLVGTRSDLIAWAGLLAIVATMLVVGLTS